MDEESAPELRLSLRTCFNVDVRRRTSLWNARAQICSKLSFCHLSQGNAQSALQAADDAVKAAPALAEAHAQRARALGALGRPARSAAYAAMLFAEAAGEDTTEYRAMWGKNSTTVPEAPRTLSPSGATHASLDGLPGSSWLCLRSFLEPRCCKRLRESARSTCNLTRVCFEACFAKQML